MLLFTVEFLALSRPDHLRSKQNPILRRGVARPILNLTEKQAVDISAWIGMLRKESSQEAAGQREAIGALLNLLLIDIERILDSSLNGPETKGILQEAPSGALIEQFIDIVNDSFHALHRVREYADLLNVSPGHLNDVVRSDYGTTASSLIRDRVLLEARRLLAHSNESIKEIAYAIGYEDPSYFTRLFREQIGVAPGEFRKKFRP